MTSLIACRVPLVALIVGLGVVSCSKKGPECKALITSMNDLGAKLAVTQQATNAADVQPAQVAAALKPFAIASKGVADSLTANAPTVPELKKIASEAAAAALALSTNSAQMTEYAEQMKGLDAASKAVDDAKKVVDGAEAEIKKFCEANGAKCGELAKVLNAFPPPPDKSEAAQATAAWIVKLNAWAANLAKVEIQDPGLKQQVQTFDKGWKDFGAAMTKLVAIMELAKKYEELTKAFNGQIDQANKAIAEANAFCVK
jgi:hypothetical protein